MVEAAKGPNRRGRLVWLVQGAATLAFVGWLASRIDSATIATIGAVSLPVFISAVLIYSLSQFWCALRLQVLIANGPNPQRPPRFSYLLRLTFSTLFIGNFLPGTVGADVVKAVALVRRSIPLSATVSALLLDRLTNLAAALALSVATIGIAAPELLAKAQINGALVLTLFGLGVALVVGLVMLGRLSAMIAYAIEATRKLALSWLEAPLVLGAAVLFSIFSLLSAVAAQWILASRLGMSISLLQLTAVVCIVYIVALAPITLNGVGLQEVSAIVLLAQFGVPERIGLSFALLTRLLVLALSLVGGAVTAADRSLFADLRQGAGSPSRLLELYRESRIKRLFDSLPLARQSRSRR